MESGEILILINTCYLMASLLKIRQIGCPTLNVQKSCVAVHRTCLKNWCNELEFESTLVGPIKRNMNCLYCAESIICWNKYV